jgi:hypothetical protein
MSNAEKAASRGIPLAAALQNPFVRLAEHQYGFEGS